MTGKIEIERKTRQTFENKQTFDLNFDGRQKLNMMGKTRQNAENIQTFGFMGKN